VRWVRESVERMTDVRLEGITVLADDVQALADFFDGVPDRRAANR
jgi:hypothetical protein